MIRARHQVIGAGLWALRTSRLYRLAAPLTRGLGAILAFHRVRSWADDGFAPNRLLEITPAFLDTLLGHVRRDGYRLVRMDEVPGLLLRGGGQPFLALTFDDGYRDTLTEALPVLVRHEAPFTVYAAPGFADRTARLWWVELEFAIRQLVSVSVRIGGRTRVIPTRDAREKERTFEEIRLGLLAGTDADLLEACAGLCAQAGISPASILNDLCMDWRELRDLARHPLASVGCHSLTHPRLSLLDRSSLDTEMTASRAALETELGRPVRHFCYPYGMASAAGRREFEAAAALGYDSAVTTRPGLLHAMHAKQPTALPRVSVNGLWQSTAALDILLSGVGFALWNRSLRPAPL